MHIRHPYLLPLLHLLKQVLIHLFLKKILKFHHPLFSKCLSNLLHRLHKHSPQCSHPPIAYLFFPITSLTACQLFSDTLKTIIELNNGGYRVTSLSGCPSRSPNKSKLPPSAKEKSPFT